MLGTGVRIFFSEYPQKTLEICRTMSGRRILSCSVAELPDVFRVVFREIFVFTVPVHSQSKVSIDNTTSRDATPR
jgi:hypothetical protein